MATVVLSAALWYRQATASNNIGIAGSVLLAYRPNALFEARFQLTLLASSLELRFQAIRGSLPEVLKCIARGRPQFQIPPAGLSVWHSISIECLE